jgi:hypothetical protein
LLRVTGAILIDDRQKAEPLTSWNASPSLSKEIRPKRLDVYSAEAQAVGALVKGLSAVLWEHLPLGPEGHIAGL